MITGLARIFDDYSHSMPAVVIREVAQHPYAGLIHVDERRDTFGGAEPEQVVSTEAAAHLLVQTGSLFSGCA